MKKQLVLLIVVMIVAASILYIEGPQGRQLNLARLTPELVELVSKSEDSQSDSKKVQMMDANEVFSKAPSVADFQAELRGLSIAELEAQLRLVEAEIAKGQLFTKANSSSISSAEQLQLIKAVRKKLALHRQLIEVTLAQAGV